MEVMTTMLLFVMRWVCDVCQLLFAMCWLLFMCVFMCVVDVIGCNVLFTDW